MGRSLSLAAYRALSWRKPQHSAGPRPPRPSGELVWVHSDTRARFDALQELCDRLQQMRPGIHVLHTCPAETATSEALPIGPDHPGSARAFLNHWRPDLCIWSGGDLRPNLISQASERNVPMLLLDFSADDPGLNRKRWLPDLVRSTLQCFDTVLVESENSAHYLRRAGISENRISLSAPLRSGANPSPCSEDALHELNEALASRPVWLAAYASPKEFETILQAHRSALRLAHRLLLVLMLDDPRDLPEMNAQLDKSRLRHADWDEGDEIQDSTQVLVSGDPAALGLWYRVAPLSFMASSLVKGTGGRNPMEAIALGSALLYGPHIGDHMDTYARLSQVGAARVVRDADELGASVVRLIAPDNAAEMALAGWKLITEGAHLTDRLLDLVQDKLDLAEVNHAGT
ncbi:3-deoxy-D-manno-octulosonic acid transferase [Primorskyibacter sp. S87]|uniref:3-deoxy-D-manno-octulosonic acid transferase n=1 Tax=Primorskyibacter sp. S87 TaxID=3415126 RepID=UPI003C7B23BB